MGAISWAERLMQKYYEDEGYTVISVGAPDFILLKGNRVEFVEIKTKYDQPSEAQKRAIRLLKEHGFTARSEKIRCFKAYGDRKGYHKIEILRKGCGNNRYAHMISSIVERLIGNANPNSLY